MEQLQGDEYCIPVVVCGKCEEKVPLSHQGTMTKEGHEDIEIWSTPCCDIVPYDENSIVGYISLQELQEDWGYTPEPLIVEKK